MIRYAYAQLPGGRPPAPFVHVILRGLGPDAGHEATGLPAQIDSGADQTVIPQQLVDRFTLTPLDTVKVAGFGGVTTVRDTYLVELEIHGQQPLTVEVIAANEPWILLGRDVDNHFRMLHDGPANALEIG